MKPTFTIRKNFHYQIILILCLLLASAVAGFSRGITDLRINPYLRSETVKPSYLEKYKEGMRALYSFKRIIAVYQDDTEVRNNSAQTVYAKVTTADIVIDGQCYSDHFKYCAGEEIEIEIEAEEGYQNYKWFKDGVEITGVTGNTYTVTAPGSYHFEAEDPETCEAKLCCPYLVTQEQEFDAVITKVDASCASGTTGSITVTPSVGAVTDYTYSLNGGPFQASNSFTDLAGGSYTVTAKNAAGCTVEKTVDLVQPGGIAATVKAECDGNLTTATITATGGVAPYTYSLDGGAFVNDPVFTALPQGQHEVVVKDANGCTYKVIIDAYCECTPEIYEYCPGEAIEILAEAAPGQGNYQWYKNGEPIDGATGETYTITAIGSYHYTAGGDETCEGELCCPVIVREKEAPEVTLEGGELSCTTTTVQLTTGADPANTFSWTGPNGFTGNTPAVTVSEPGTYSVTVTGTNGCSTEANAVVTQNSEVPTVTVAGGELTCEVTSLVLTANASDGVTYSWTGPGGITSTDPTLTATAPGEYKVVVTSANGCKAEAVAVVTQNSDVPTVTVAGGKLTCEIPSLVLTADASAGVTYSWTGPGGITSADASITAAVPGDYKVVVTSANGCKAEATATVTEDKVLPTVTVEGGKLTCEATSIELTAEASAGVTYSWTGPGAFTATTQKITVTEAGDYKVVVTSANGCTAEATATVTEDSTVPTVTVAGGKLTCEATSIELTAEASAGVTYSWTGPGAFTATTQKITVTEAGDYKVVVTSENGCTAEATATVTEDKTLPTVTVNGGVLTCKPEGLVLTANASAGVTYSWTGPEGITSTESTITATVAGEYKVVVTTASGCTAEATAVVTAAGTPTLVATPSCVDNKGTVTLLASGGLAPYTYSKDGVTFQTEAVFSGLINGNYVFTVKDANDCIFTVTAVVKCEIECVPQIYYFCDNEAIELTIEAEDGLENYQWYRNGEAIAGATGWIYTATQPGRYHYTAGTGDQCDGILCCPIEIIRHPGFVATAIAGTLDCSSGQPIVPVTVTVGGGVGPFVYSMDGVNFSSNPVFHVGPGTHKFYVKDANDCVNETNAVIVPEIEKPSTPIVTLVGKNTVCGNEKATLTGACENGEVVKWNNGMVGPTIQVGEGTYWAVCSNICGDSPGSAPIQIIKRSVPTPPVIATDNNFVCGKELATLTANCTVGDVIEWSNGMYGDKIQVGVGIYSARCKNECGISEDSGKITITGGKVPGTPDVGTDKPMVCGDEKATLVAHCEVGSIAIWSNGMTGSPIQVGEGIYTAICRNDCGDSGDSRHITINKGMVPAPPTISATDLFVCGEEKVKLSAICEVGATIHWDNNMEGKDIYVGAGIYRAVCKNICGTSSESIPVIIGKDKLPSAPSVATDRTTVCGEEKAKLTATCESGIIVWNTGMVGSPIEVGTGTYFARCSTDCGISVASTPITITTGGVPDKPTVTPEKLTVCGDELVKLTAYCASGTVSWVGVTGFNNTVYVGTGIYAARCTNACGTSVTSEPVTITPGTTPGKPTVSTNTTGVCGQEKATLTGTCPTGGDLVWSNNMTGSPIQVGIGFYTARCVSSCGTSVASDMIVIEPGVRPGRPSISTNKPSVCGDEKAMLSGSCPSGGTLIWSTGASGNQTLVGPGTYYANCVNECGTSQASNTITITTGLLPGKPTIGTDKLTVCGEEKATLSGICPAGSTLIWSNGMTANKITVSAGTYYANCVSDCGSSPNSETIVIVPGAAPGKPTISTNKPTLCEGEKATLQGACSSGELVWSNGLTGNSVQVGPGTYSAVCVNSCGESQASNSITIDRGPAPAQPTIRTNKHSVCGTDKASLTGSCPSGGMLTWNTGQTGSPILVGVGTYTATCVNACGTSTASEPIVIGTGEAPAAPTVVPSKTLLCGTETATLTATCTSGTVRWSDGITTNPRTVGAGTYTATCVSDCGTSAASTPVVITTQPAPTAPHITTNKSIVCGTDQATLSGSCPSGGILTWSNGKTGSPILVGAGTYTATCVSECGASPASAPIVIGTGNAPAAPTVVPSKTVLCGTETATLTATCTTGTVRWSDGITANPRTVGAGTYTATCVSDCGTSAASTPVVITTQPVPTAPHITTNKSIVCGTDQATLSGSCPSGGILTWSNGKTGSPVLVGAGTYTATCVSTCGASPASAPIVIGTGDAPEAPVVAADKTALCGTEKATLTASGCAGTVTWSTGATGTSIQVGAGTYTATCTTTCGTSGKSVPVTIKTSDRPAAPSVSTDKTMICVSEKATLTANGCAGTVTWSTGATGTSIQVGYAGTFTATCTTSCGTSDASAPVTIGISDGPETPSVSTNKTKVCGADKATLTATGCKGTITWSTGATGTTIQVGAGTYTATCTTTCGTSSASAPIVIGTGDAPAAPTVVPSKNVLCGTETATLTATCTSGTVRWSDGITANPRTVGAGTYTATCVSDCGTSVVSTPVVITTLPAPTAPHITTNKSIVCGTDQATLSGSCPSGGILTWSNGKTGSPILVGVGTYTATCVSECGASPTSAPIVIGTGNAPAAPTVVPSKTVLCGTETATLTATCTSGTVRWIDGNTANQRTVGAGTYTAVCVNDCGSSPASTPVVITTQPAPAAPHITTNKSSVCGTDQATLSGSCPSGGILTWSNGKTGSPILVGAGTYTATCVSDCGASPASAPIVIGTDNAPAAPVVATDKTMLCEAETATIVANCTSGTVRWNDGNTTNPRQVGAGTYTATCVTSCGTSAASTQLVITKQNKPGAPSVTTNKNTVCDNETATLTATCATGTVLWSDGNTANPRQAGQGTYTATCVNACGASANSNTVVINRGPVPSKPNVQTNRNTVCGTDKASLSGSCPAGGTLTWSNGKTGSPVLVGVGTYTATCVNACGASEVSETIVIGDGNKPAAPVITTSKSVLCGAETATLTATGCAGGTVHWSNGGTGTTKVVTAGTYTATCVTVCGTSDNSAPVTITQESAPANFTISTSTATVCGTEKAKLTATGCEGGTVTWSTGATGASIQVGAGSYSATCKTTCGGTVSAGPVVIGQENAPAKPSIATNKATVCGDEKATLTASGCTGTITWYKPGTGGATTIGTGTTVQVGAGTYTATCTASCGTSPASDPVMIGTSDKPAAPSVSADKTTVCEGEKATLTAAGCAGTITWSTGATGSSIQVGAGTYTATCTTACGTSSASFPVTIGSAPKPAAPSVSADKATVCENEKATLTAGGCAGTITWSTGATGNSIQVGAGTYTATCTSGCGTSDASAPVTIGTSDKPAAPSVATNKAAVCENEKATLTASGCAGTVTWSTGATGSSIQVGAGTYTATCTSGCGTSAASTPVTIGTSPKPAAPSVSADKATVCEGEKATLTTTGCAGTITWSTGQTVSVIQVGTGTYTATCTTTCGTSAASAPVTIGTSDKPAAPSVSADKATVCEGEKATLTATGCAGTITWSTGQTVSVIQVGTGTYTATCTTTCGTSAASVPVTIGTSDKPAAPSVATDKNTVCDNEKATLTATGCAGTITWSTNATGVSIQVGAGTYTATCTTSCGTSVASASVTIGTSDKPAAPSVTTDKNTVCDNERARLVANGCAGTVTWSNGLTGSIIEVGAGVYTAVCTSGCGTSDVSAPVTIGTSDKPAAPSVSTDKSTVCESEVATLTAGGCAGTVTWSNGSTGTSIQVGAGTYTAKCATSCGTSEVSSPVTIGTSEKPAKPFITASGSSVCGEEKVTLTASGCAGTVNWLNGATGTSILVGAGTYTATCTTSCGTSDGAVVTINEGGSPEPPVVTVDRNSICGNEKATLTATGCVGGVVTWSTGETGFQIQVGAGVYTATCVDACGNESIACVAVEVDNNATAPETPVISASTDGVCGEELATLTAGGCTGGTVIWSNGSQGHSIQVSAGTYTAICKTDCGESAASNSVTIHAKGGALSVSSDKTTYCAGETVTLTATGCTNGIVRWSNGATGNSITLVASASTTMTAVCSADGSISAGSCDFAVGDVEFNYEAQQNPNGMNTRFLLTSNSYEILQVKNTPKFENVQEGAYKVISVVYIGDITGLVVGANYSDLNKGECYSDEETEISVCDPEIPQGECAAVGSVRVQVKPAGECGNGGNEGCEVVPVVTSSVGSATCIGTSVTLTAMNCNAQVVWSNGATGASINFVPTATGAYKFSAKCVSAAAGCESAASQEITVNVVDALPKPIAIETLNNICPLTYVDLRNAILGTPTSGGTFEFRYENSPSSALVTSAQVTAGVYYLFERNTAGCYSEGTPVTVVISGDCENPVNPTEIDVAINKTGDKATAEVGEEVTYTVTVSNVGEEEASDIKVRDILPAGLELTQVSDNAFIEEGVVRSSIPTLAPGASVEITYTATVKAPGKIVNKAEIQEVGQSDSNLDNNSSTWVLNNVAQVDSLIGLAKAVGTIALREDMGANIYEVPFLFTITNMGLKDLDHVSLKDTLSLTFGNEEMVESVYLEADPGLTVNPNYSGSGEQTDLLIPGESAIAAGATLNVRLKVFVNMGEQASGNFANSATVYAGTENVISDKSTDGVNPDPDADGDPTNNNVPTEFTIGEGTPEYGIGAALAVIDEAFVNNGIAYEVTYRAQVRNFGPATITGVFLTDTLTNTFAEAVEFTVTGAPVVTSAGSSLVVNPDFDGKTDFRLLLPDAEAVLAPGQTDTVEFKVTVVFGTYTGPYSTNVIAFAEDNGTALTDTSNAGDEIIVHLSTPTVFNVPGDEDPRSMVDIPEGFSPNGDGINDNWKIELKGNAQVEKLIIVNRYGATLYEEDGETVTTSGWDGKANKGVIPGTGTVPTGTYYYKLKLVGQDKFIIDYITVER